LAPPRRIRSLPKVAKQILHCTARDADEVIVTSLLLRREGPLIAVTWRLAVRGAPRSTVSLDLPETASAVHRITLVARTGRFGGEVFQVPRGKAALVP
jgi:hypothetical protein